MKRKCCVFSCSSKSYGSNIAKVTWHKLPKDENKYEKWKQVLLKNNPKLKNLDMRALYICSLHFERKHFKITTKRKHNLTSDAVPTIFQQSNQNVCIN